VVCRQCLSPKEKGLHTCRHSTGKPQALDETKSEEVKRTLARIYKELDELVPHMGQTSVQLLYDARNAVKGAIGRLLDEEKKVELEALIRKEQGV
jgi:hypothetical protein